MSLDYLNEAFKKLDAISLNEEAFNTSFTGINDLAAFMDQDDTSDFVRVIDPDVTDPADLSDSYVGKVITECTVCHSKIFTAKDDIIIEDDGAVNIETQCPYCGEFSGFTILGEISPFKEVDENEDPTEESPEVKVDGEEVPVDTPEGEPLEESLEPCNDYTLEKYFNDVEDGEGWVTVEKAVFDMNTLGCPKSADEIKEFVSTYSRAYMLTFAGIEIIFTPTAPSYETVGKELGIDEASLTECVKKVTHSINEAKVRDFKPHTIRLLKLIGSDLVNGLEEEVLTEAMNNVNVETDDTIVSVNSDENGKITVSTEPKAEETPETSDEMITPVSDDTLADIEANNQPEEDSAEEEPAAEEPAEEEPAAEETPTEENEEVDVDFEDVDEEALDELGESYFKRVYENVDSFKTTRVALNPTKFIVEGLIKFNSGISKKTGFVFEADSINSAGQIKFLGENLQLSRGKKAFGLTGTICDKKFLPESFSYNYRTKNVKDNEDRVSGVVTRK